MRLIGLSTSSGEGVEWFVLSAVPEGEASVERVESARWGALARESSSMTVRRSGAGAGTECLVPHPTQAMRRSRAEVSLMNPANSETAENPILTRQDFFLPVLALC